jgi:uncharacterized protein (DUF433 family)
MRKPGQNSVISAFTEDHVERLTGISVHRLRYWDRTGFFRPSYGAENRRNPYSRIYSFMDVAALRVLSVLITQHNVPLQHLRQVSADLGAMDNSAWSRTTLYVFGKTVVFEEDSRKVEAGSGQYVIGIPLEKIVSDTRRDVKVLSTRTDDQIGHIARHRFVSHNSPVVAGTRIPVTAIRHFAEDGYSVKQIMAEYPTLTEADIKAALEFEENKAA